jgi:hypothetical protein
MTFTLEQLLLACVASYAAAIVSAGLIAVFFIGADRARRRSF